MGKRRRRKRKEPMLPAVLCGLGCICIVLLVTIGFLVFRGRGDGDRAGKEDTVPTEETEGQETEEAAPEETEEETAEEPLPEEEEAELEVHFIDVGQGDATLIRCKGHAMLLDTGSADADARRSDRDLLEYLQENGVERLDMLLLSHGHEDHMGRACDILETMEVDRVICDFGNEEGYVQRLEQMLEDTGQEVVIPAQGDVYPLGDASVHILTGRLTELEESDTEIERVNNQSIGVKLIYGETSFLFYGDGDAAYEQYLLELNRDIGADVLKVPHHGAAVSCCEQILERVQPEYAVISSAKQEDFGFPSAEVLLRLTARQITTFYTNKQGNIIAASDGENICWTTRR